MILDDHWSGGPPVSALLIESTPEALMREPLDFIFAEHFRHRQMCRIVEHLAKASAPDVDLVAQLDDFIRYDLALHIIDEEEDLFPLMRRRCVPEDDIERVLGRLSRDHAEDQRVAGQVRAALAEAMALRAPVSAIEGAADVLLRFARQERDHVALENAVVMPIARLRLTRADLDGLSRRLAARRGVVLAEPAA